MKNHLLIILALLLSVAALGFSYQSPKPAVWEYKVEQCKENKLNALGAQGWEMVGAEPGISGGGVCWLKRPKS